MKPIVLDRDGVINIDSDDYVKSAEEWLPIPGSIKAIAALSRAGFDIFIATNQSGLGRGLYSPLSLEQMHSKFLTLVEEAGGKIGGIVFCPHTPEDNCECRKPKTGLLKEIESKFACRLANAFFVGDSTRDIQAALAYGCKPVLVKTGKGRQSIVKLNELGIIDFLVFDDLASAARFIINAE